MAQQKQPPAAAPADAPEPDHDDGILVETKSPPTPEEVRGWNIYQRMYHAADLISMVGKTRFNSFHKYKYASHDDVVAKVRQAFQLCGILCVTNIAEHKLETQQMPDDTGKVKYQTIATILEEVSFINPDQPEDRYTIQVPAYAYDTSDKALGKAISYAKKYALVALSGLMLATGDDADQDHIETDAMERARQAKTSPATPAQSAPAPAAPKPAPPAQASTAAKTVAKPVTPPAQQAPSAKAGDTSKGMLAKLALQVIQKHKDDYSAKTPLADVIVYGDAFGLMMTGNAEAVRLHIESKGGTMSKATAPHIRALVDRWSAVYPHFQKLWGLAKQQCGTGHTEQAHALLGDLQKREGWTWTTVSLEVVAKCAAEIEATGQWFPVAPAADAAPAN